MRRPSGRTLLGLLLTGALCGTGLLVPATPAAALPGYTAKFDYTGQEVLWTVPDRVAELQVQAFGAQGGTGGPRGAGGLGGFATYFVPVKPGDVISVRVGGQGGQVRTPGWPDGGSGGHQGGPAGNDGAGGGGSSSVRTATGIQPIGFQPWIIVAGGGGGGGGSQAGAGSDGGNGGTADANGGGGTAPAGLDCAVPAHLDSAGGQRGHDGQGGLGSTGRNCGAGTPGTGSAGNGGRGGNGADAEPLLGGGGGGGGGGWGGGGGGGAPNSGGGGGDGGGGGGNGGRGPLTPVITPVPTGGDQVGNGHIDIFYIPGYRTSTMLTSSPADPVSGQAVTLSATVSPVPNGGTVQFAVDGQAAGDPVPVDTSTGVAVSAPLTALGTGSHTTGAIYNGTTDFTASTAFAPSDTAQSLTVRPDTDAPVVTVTAPAPPAGQHGYFNRADLANAGGSVPLTVSASDTSGTVTDLACTDNGAAVPVAGQSGSNPRTGTVPVSLDGTHVIVCTATDSNGNSGNNGGPNTVTVKIDTTPPTLTVPTSPLAVDATRPDGAQLASYPVTAADPDPGDSPTVACDPAAPHQFPIGDTVVSCRATDQAGNTSDAEPFTVHVRGAEEQLSDLEAAVQGLPFGGMLAAKVADAERELRCGHPAQACFHLREVGEVLRILRGRSIPADQADRLTADATRIRAVIGCR